MVLDNASWHKKAVKLIWGDEEEEYQDIRDRMCYLFLPPYCPMLNPIEQVWRIARREVTQNRSFDRLPCLNKASNDIFTDHRKSYEEFRTLIDLHYSLLDEIGNLIKGGKIVMRNMIVYTPTMPPNDKQAVKTGARK